MLCPPPTVLLPTPGSVPVIRHARYSAHGIGGSALLPLPAPLFLFPAKAALGDQQPVSLLVVSPLFASVEALAPVGALKVVAALSTGAVSVRRRGGIKSSIQFFFSFTNGNFIYSFTGEVLVQDAEPGVCLTSEEPVCQSPLRRRRRTKAVVKQRTCSECWWLDGYLPLSLGIQTETHTIYFSFDANGVKK